jgi:hypothetical protein
MLLPEEEFLKLPVIILAGLERNPEVRYSVLQKFLLPYMDIMQTAWWVCFALVLAFLVARYFVLPLLNCNKQSFTDLCKQVVTDDVTLVPEKTASDSLFVKFKRFYVRIFSLNEIAQDAALRLFGGGIALGYLFTFNYWQMNRLTTVDGLRTGDVQCWPFFQSCKDWIWMETLPVGYSQTIVFMVMFAVIVLAFYGFLTRRIILSHVCIFVLFLFKVYLTLTAFTYGANYDYYLNLFSVIFLFLPYKRFFASFILVWFYFLSTVSKNHPSWVWGGYFSALTTGLPLIPRGLEPLACNLVIFMEMVMAWFLFSRRVWVQRTVFAFFCFFHVYSGTIVGYHYPTIVMPVLLIFFGTLFRPFKGIPINLKALPGWIMVVTIFWCTMLNLFIPGDTKLTLQANYYGPYMFEANHQCRVTMTSNNFTVNSNDFINARFRCDPWIFLSHGQQALCQTGSTQKVIFKFIHSVNGGPFYEIVNEPDLCSLKYNAFHANAWIKTEKTAPMVGRPLENTYR